MDAVAKVGSKAPDFELKDLEGQQRSLKEQAGQVVVLSFWSAECPWSRKADEYIEEKGLEAAWGSDVVHWRIASNANESEQALEQAAEKRGVDPVLFDSDQQVADLFGAMTTPHVFVIDPDGVLRYGGSMNDATWRQPEPTEDYLEQAVAAARQGQSPEPAETPGRGCTIVRHTAD